MTQSDSLNRNLILAKHPKGKPNAITLRLVTEAIPTAVKGQMLLGNEFLSLDP